MRKFGRVGTAALGGLALALIATATAVPAGAETVDVVVDASPVQLAAADGGAHKTSVGITNVSTEPVIWSLVATVNKDPGCTITPKSGSVDPATQTKVTFTFDTGCNTDGGIDFFIEFDDSVEPESIELRAKPAPAAASPDWEILGLAALFGGVATMLMVVLILIAIGRIREAKATPAAAEKRWIEQLIDNNRRATARAMVGLPPPPAPTTPAAGPDPPTIGWGTQLLGLGTNWSFKDAWVANVTLGAAALVGLVAASNVLEPILGDEAKPVIGLVAVVAGIAAVFVTIGPLILKAFGSDVGIPTVGGTVTAAAVVVGGTLFQVSALTIQSARLVENELLETAIAVGGLAIAFFVGRYAVLSVGGLIANNLTKPPRSISDPERAALIITSVLVPGTGDMPMTPADVADILAADPEFAALGLGTSPGDEPLRTALI